MTKPKNIVLIITDEERFPAHFPDAVEFPARRWLAERGVSLSRWHTNAIPCTPSRSVLFTGQHTAKNRMIDNTSMPYIADLDPSIPTLGHMLGGAGYYCAYKGKWHLASIAQTWEPRHTTENDMQRYGFNDYQHYGDLALMAREGYLHDSEIVTDAIHWLRMRESFPTEAQADRPFFLTVSLVNPHDIMTVGLGNPPLSPNPRTQPLPPPDEAVYRHTWSVDMCQSWQTDYYAETLDSRPAAHSEMERIWDWNFGTMTKDEALWRRYIDYYINCQHDVDREIGRLVSYLESAGRLDDTIIVFTADHGEMAGAHGLRTKGPYMYKENIHVPLVIVHPDGQRGVVNDTLGCHLDIAPTVTALAGMDDATRRAEFPDLRGHDVSRAVFEAGFRSPRDSADDGLGVLVTYTALSTLDADVMTGETEVYNPTKRGLMLGIFDGRYKYARYFSPVNYLRPGALADLLCNFDIELYDTESDPDELVNLASEDNGALVWAMNQKLDALLDRELGERGEIVEYELPSVDTLKAGRFI